MSGKLKGGLSIMRPSGYDFDVIQISLNDDLSGSQCVEISISLEGFARALTGQGYIPCEFEWRPQVVGMRREHKEVAVPFDGRWTAYANRADVAAPVLAPYEVDGWKGRVDDLFNHHRKATSGYRVTFVRHVPVTEDEGAKR